MDKIALFLSKPFNLFMVAIFGFVISLFVALNYKMEKLAELEYAEDVREKQDELVKKYDTVEDEIKDRHHDMVKWNENVAKNVEIEIEKAKNEDSKSYSITATDSNASELLK